MCSIEGALFPRENPGFYHSQDPAFLFTCLIEAPVTLLVRAFRGVLDVIGGVGGIPAR